MDEKKKCADCAFQDLCGSYQGIIAMYSNIRAMIINTWCVCAGEPPKRVYKTEERKEEEAHFNLVRNDLLAFLASSCAIYVKK